MPARRRAGKAHAGRYTGCLALFGAGRAGGRDDLRQSGWPDWANVSYLKDGRRQGTIYYDIVTNAARQGAG